MQNPGRSGFKASNQLSCALKKIYFFGKKLIQRSNRREEPKLVFETTSKIITLTTDFGLEDHFVGVMKGVILSRAPDVLIVDLCHNIPAGDITKAVFILSSSIHYFPKATIHVIVVDPGVGTSRRILYIESRGHRFLAPDNGVLSFIPNDEIEFVVDVRDKKYFLDRVSNTFHGRDIFAPVAGYLASGLAPLLLGPKIEASSIKSLNFSCPLKIENGIKGEVIAVDHFGNLITNILSHHIKELGESKDMSISIENTNHILNLSNAYADVEEGTLVALIGSSDALEIGINKGNASHILSRGKGLTVTVTRN